MVATERATKVAATACAAAGSSLRRGSPSAGLNAQSARFCWTSHASCAAARVRARRPHDAAARSWGTTRRSKTRGAVAEIVERFAG